MKRLTSLVLTAALVVSLCVIGVRADTPPAELSDVCTNEEWQMLRLVNEQRLEQELSPLSIFPDLQSAAYVRKQDGRILGMIQVRHYLNDYLRDYAGHIGYSVRPSERRKGVATAMLREVLPFCKSIGLDRVMIACEPCNPGSRGTILNNGGEYWRTVHFAPEDIDLEHYWVAT